MHQSKPFRGPVHGHTGPGANPLSAHLLALQSCPTRRGSNGYWPRHLSSQLRNCTGDGYTEIRSSTSCEFRVFDYVATSQLRELQALIVLALGFLTGNFWE